MKYTICLDIDPETVYACTITQAYKAASLLKHIKLLITHFHGSSRAFCGGSDDAAVSDIPWMTFLVESFSISAFRKLVPRIAQNFRVFELQSKGAEF